MDHYTFLGDCPSDPSPKPKLTLIITSHLGQNVGLGEGYVCSFPETYNDPKSFGESSDATG